MKARIEKIADAKPWVDEDGFMTGFGFLMLAVIGLVAIVPVAGIATILTLALGTNVPAIIAMGWVLVVVLVLSFLATISEPM